jgi:hypothetical protein
VLIVQVFEKGMQANHTPQQVSDAWHRGEPGSPVPVSIPSWPIMTGILSPPFRTGQATDFFAVTGHAKAAGSLMIEARSGWRLVMKI